MPTPKKYPKEVQSILDREAELQSELDALNDADFERIKQTAIAKASNPQATAEDMEEAAEALDGRLGTRYFGKREAVWLALKSHRSASFPIFRDQIIVPALEARKARLKAIGEDVASLNKKYPGSCVKFDPTYDEAATRQLQEIAWRDSADEFTAILDMTGYSKYEEFYA